MRLPIESHTLQAFVSEGLKPFIDGVITYGAGHFYVSQSDKGGLVFGGDIDGYNSYAQRGNLPVIEDVAEGGMSLMPSIGRARLLRAWGGIMDMSMDGSPIIDKTPIQGLYFNGGWCYGGFKATPGSGLTFAHLIATGESHDIARHFDLERFADGRTIDERGAGPPFSSPSFSSFETSRESPASPPAAAGLPWPSRRPLRAASAGPDRRTPPASCSAWSCRPEPPSHCR